MYHTLLNGVRYIAFSVKVPYFFILALYSSILPPTQIKAIMI